MYNSQLHGNKLSADGKVLRDEALRIVARAKSEGRSALTELEGMALLSAMGIRTPKYWLVQSADEFLEKVRKSAQEIPKTKKGADGDTFSDASGGAFRVSGGGSARSPFPGAKAVVKIISPQILHKTEVQGVEIVENAAEAIAAALRRMESRFGGVPRDGFTVNEFVAFEPKLGHEMIFGYRFAPDFGPIVSFGPGGIYTEYLASKFKAGAANLMLSPRVSDQKTLETLLKENVVYGLLCAGLRNTKRELEPGALQEAIQHFLDAADALAAAGIGEFEVNPMVLSRAGELVALDCLVTLKDFSSLGLARDEDGLPVNMAQRIRPVREIGRILKPASAAVIGVSEKNMNNGRIILRNLIENGFDTSRLYVVKPETESIDGCRCVPDIASLPEKVDLFVLVIPAAATPSTLADIARQDKAWTIIVIPGGLEEKSGSGAIVAEMHRALADARAQGKGPLINGGNCLGIRSVPGKYNTLFIPEYKLPMPKGKVEPLALISQSGAFAVTRLSKHQNINPKYALTLGNQMDLTIGDYLDYLAQDTELHVFAVYVEGFKPLDGEKTLEACRRISESGRSVILYRAGRTQAGAGAAASHTASIAGDYPVTKQLFAQAGAIVCDSLDEFDDAITLFTLLDGRKARGNRLAAVSNAGFECVAIADNLGGMKLSSFGETTRSALEEIFKKARIAEIVDIHNPVDLTPMAGDDAYDGAFRMALFDPDSDLGIVGIVPLTGMMNSLPANPSAHNEDITREDSLAVRYDKLVGETDKPFVAVVDAGPLYDPLCLELEKRGIVVFRTADRALKMLELWRKSPAGRSE
jgi:acyl-CoA synthetase (NDP forming)